MCKVNYITTIKYPQETLVKYLIKHIKRILYNEKSLEKTIIKK